MAGTYKDAKDWLEQAIEEGLISNDQITSFLLCSVDNDDIEQWFNISMERNEDNPGAEDIYCVECQRDIDPDNYNADEDMCNECAEEMATEAEDDPEYDEIDEYEYEYEKIIDQDVMFGDGDRLWIGRTIDFMVATGKYIVRSNASQFYVRPEDLTILKADPDNDYWWWMDTNVYPFPSSVSAYTPDTNTNNVRLGRPGSVAFDLGVHGAGEAVPVIQDLSALADTWPEIPVIFRHWAGEVLALFPDTPAANLTGMASFSRSEGFTRAVDYIHILPASRPASLDEYEMMFDYLKVHLPCKLVVCEKRTRAHIDTFNKRVTDLRIRASGSA